MRFFYVTDYYLPVVYTICAELLVGLITPLLGRELFGTGVIMVFGSEEAELG